MSYFQFQIKLLQDKNKTKQPKGNMFKKDNDEEDTKTKK
jgi:hypothetical protein